MKIWWRAALLLAGVGLLVLGWHYSRMQPVTALNPTPNVTGGGGEVLVVIGLFIALAAFAPSSKIVGRWMSVKRHRRGTAPHLRRRRRV